MPIYSYTEFLMESVNKQNATLTKFLSLFDAYLQAEGKNERADAFMDLVYTAEAFGGWEFVNSCLGKNMTADKDRVRRDILKAILLRK